MTHQIFTVPPQQPLTAAGRVLPGAKARFFITETSTPTPVYTTADLNVAHTQPVVADAGGRFDPIYLDPTIVYKLTVTDANDVLLYTVDPCNDQLLSAAIIGEYLYPRTDAEVSAGVTPTNYAYEPGDERRYGVVADGVADDTTALNNAYDACRAGDYDLKLMIRGTRLITSQLVWDAPVDVIGISREDCIISASGNFYAIKIDVDGEQALYENFTVDRVSGTGGGIDIYLGNRITIRRVICQNQSGHGILLRAGNLGTYQAIICRDNTASGVVINSGSNPDLPSQSAWSCTWSDIDCIRNDEYGFNIAAGNSHFGFGVVCQHNGLGGFYCNSNTNTFFVYCEANTVGPIDNDVELTSSSVRNIVFINNALNVDSITDGGTNNVVHDCAVYPVISVPNIFPLRRSTNVAGRTMSIAGGAAGAGATGRAGGPLNLTGGAAAGSSGAAAGEDVNLEGGVGVNGGAKGSIHIVASNITHARTLAGGGYSASITPDARAGKHQDIRPNNGSAFTINAPTNAREGDELKLKISNISGGALGAITWNSVFKMSSWTSPATGFSRSITFSFDGSNWIQDNQTGVDVPN